MAVEVQTVVASMQGLLPVDRFGLRELEEIRLVLRGGSVIDWRRLNFSTEEEVDAYLRLCLLNPERPADLEFLRTILDEAVDYLRSVFRYRVTEVVAKPSRIQELFLIASGVGEHRRWRRIACIVLKVMHTIFHTDSRDRLFRTPVSEQDVAALVDLRVQEVVRQMRERGIPVVEFTGNVKSRESMITKLLSKRETIAAQVYDKVRYRVVTDRYENILPVLHHLTCHLFPFNFVLPGQTQNTLFSFRRLVEQTPTLAKLIPLLQHDYRHEDRELREMRKRQGAVNEFSGDTYRVLNFIADVPVRLDDLLSFLDARGRPLTWSGPQIIFQSVEFQLMDDLTARQNEEGENSHERYKRRQRVKVLRRLSRGLVLPKGEKDKKGAKAKAAQNAAQNAAESNAVKPRRRDP